LFQETLFIAAMTGRFETRKKQILNQLDTPDSEYHDLSPKGSVDEPIRDLISEINALEGLVTTSSCSGRISVFLEGRKTRSDDVNTGQGEQSLAGPGGKGGGGAWLFISHCPVDGSQSQSATSYLSMFGLQNAPAEEEDAPSIDSRFVHLKFEPMVSLCIVLKRFF
jgi:tRNA wybutosine-synthesizing protein 3